MRAFLSQIVYTTGGAGGAALVGTRGQFVTVYRDAALTQVEINLQLSPAGTPLPDGRVLVDATSRTPRLQVTGGDEVPTVLYAKPDGSTLGTPLFSNAEEALARLEKEIATFTVVAMVGAGIDKTGATDSTAAIQAKLNLLTNGGQAFFPAGLYRCDGPLNLNDKNGVSLVGPGSGIDRQKTPACELRFTGGGTAPKITARRSEGFSIRGMAVRYSDAAFTGRFIDVRGDAVTPTYRPTFDDVLLGGTGGLVVNAETVVDLGNTVEPCFDNFVIARAASGVIGYDGTSTYSFAAHFGHGRFVDMVVDSVRNPHGSWTFIETVFENATNGKPAPIINTPGFLVAGLTMIGGGFYDASQPGVWLDLYGNGVTIHSARMECEAGVVLLRARTAAGVPFNGFAVRDCQIIGPSTAVFFEHVGPSYVSEFVNEGNQFLNGVADNSADQPRLRYSTRHGDSASRVTLVDASGTVGATDGTVLVNSAGGAGVTVTLPDVTDPLVKTGAHLTIKKTDATANPVTINASGGQTIEGVASLKIGGTGATVELMSDGVSSWRVLGEGRTRRGGLANVANGGSIPHGLGAIPTKVSLTSGANGFVVAAVGVSAVNIDVGVLTLAGAAGTAQPVYWTAEL